MPAHDYNPYVGIPYGERHGCFKLLETVFRECYGWDVSGLDAELDSMNDRVARLFQCIARYAEPVADEIEGDVVLVRSAPWHVGVVIQPPLMLHSFLGRHSVVSDYSTPTWRGRIEGFYRYRPAHDR